MGNKKKSTVEKKSLQFYDYSPIYTDLSGKFLNYHQYIYCYDIWVNGSYTPDPSCSPCDAREVDTIKLGSCINQYFKNSLTDDIEYFSYKIDGSVDQHNMANFTYSEYDGENCVKPTPWQYARSNQGLNWWSWRLSGQYNVTLKEECESNSVTITDYYTNALAMFKELDLVAVNTTHSSVGGCESKNSSGVLESRARSIDQNEFTWASHVNGEMVQPESPEQAVCWNPWFKGKDNCEHMFENYLIRNGSRVNELQCADTPTSKTTQGNPVYEGDSICASGDNCRYGVQVFKLDDKVHDPYIVKASDCKTDLKKPLFIKIVNTYISYREETGEAVGSLDIYYEFPKKEDPNIDSDYGRVDMFLAAKVFSSTNKGKTHKLRLGKGSDALPNDPARSMYWFQISADNHYNRVGVKTIEFVAHLPPDRMDASMDSFRVKIKQGKNLILGCKMYSQMDLPAPAEVSSR